MKDNRFRNWAFIVYPESVLNNYRDILDDLHIQWVESPLHEFDLNPDGETKKPHIHIVLSFEGKKSFDHVLDIAKSVNGSNPIKVESIRGYVRYLIHIDNPEKYQYPYQEIIGHGGFDFEQYFSYSNKQRYRIIADMMDFIEQNHITEFVSFTNYCRAVRYDDWFPMICDSCAYIIDIHIRSMRNGFKNFGRSEGLAATEVHTDPSCPGDPHDLPV